MNNSSMVYFDHKFDKEYSTVMDVSSDPNWRDVICVERHFVNGELTCHVNHRKKNFEQVCALLTAAGGKKRD